MASTAEALLGEELVADRVLAGLLLGQTTKVENDAIFIWRHGLYEVRRHLASGPSLHQIGKEFARTRIRIEEIDQMPEHKGLLVAATDIGLWPDEPEMNINMLGILGRRRLFIPLSRGSDSFMDPLRLNESIDEIEVY